MLNLFIEVTLLSNRISDYPLISQGKTRIHGINDGLEFDATDVSGSDTGVGSASVRLETKG